MLPEEAFETSSLYMMFLFEVIFIEVPIFADVAVLRFPSPAPSPVTRMHYETMMG